MSSRSAELVQASHRGDLERVKELLDSGVDINSTDQHGMGPLLTFHPHILEYLLEHGADPDHQKNEEDGPILVGIAYMHKVECVKVLLDAKADPNIAHPRSGENSLHSCLSKPREHDTAADPLVKLLLEFGCNPNHTTETGKPTSAYWRDVRTRGETPLHRAAAYATEETIELLLGNGADKTLRDANGDSPQSWASWHWRPKSIIDLLGP